MDINSQQLVNTFVGGMNTDTSDALLESNQYRYAENLRLFTNTDSNSGELRLVDGTEEKYVFENGTEILKLDKVRDIVTVITRKNNMWSVYLYKSGLNPTLLFGPCMTKIWKDGEYPNLSTVLNYESENNIKLYIADSIHLIMVLKFSANDQNITPSTYIETLSGYTEVTLPSLNVLVSDASGYLKSAKVQYAYRLYKQGGSVTRLSPLSNTLSLYKDLKSGYANGFKSGRSVKISMPTAKLPENYFVNRKLNLSTGTIIDNYNIPGRDNQIHVNEISIAEYSQSTMSEENRRYCYYIEDELCSRDLQNDPLFLSEILYSYENQTPVRGLDSTHYFEKSSDDDSTWVKQNSRLIIVQLGTSRSIKECSRVIQIPYAVLLSKALDAGCITNGAWNAGSSVSIGKRPQMWPLGGVSDYTEQSISEVLDKILIFRINYVVNGQLPEVSVIYDGDYSASREIIDYGQDDARTISVSELLSYTEFGIIPTQIEIKNNYLFAANINYSKLNVDNLFKSLLISDYFTIEQCLGEPYRINRLTQGALNTAFRPGETYRFGIIFYDEYGNKSSVFPLGNDITMGDYSLFEWLTFDDILQPGNESFVINPPTIKIKQKASIPNCSQYEIVRCIRTFSDKRTITLGLVGKPAECWDGVPATSNRTHVITPRELFSLGEIDEYTHDPNYSFNGEIRYATTSDSNILCFASPEYVYLPDDMKELLELSEGMLSIKQVANYIPNLRERTEGSDNIIYAETVSLFNFPSIFVKDTTGSTIKYKHNRAYNSTECTTERLEVSRNNKTSFIKFNLISPKLKLQTSGMFNSTAVSEIKELAYPKVPLYNEFASDDRLKFKDDVTNIADYLYVGWSAPTYTVNNMSSSGDLFNMLTNGENSHAINFPIGTTGLCILVKVSNINSFTPNPSVMTYGPFLITVADILKTTNPYGGDTIESKKNSTYYSFGDVFENKIDDHVLNSGDCYIRMFRYNALHNWFDTTISCATKCGTVYNVPMFMDIDLHGLYGEPYDYLYSNKGYYILDKAAAFDEYVQELDSYLYNTAYNAIPNIIGYSMNTDNEFASQLYDTRIHYSEQKTNNENMDNWTLFSALNFLDVDSRFGSITDLKLFKDRLMFWQERAFGILAVNERVVLNDANDTQVVLGTGSVLDRYDYVSTVYGMKLGQHTACVSNDALYWWDSYNKEVLQYVDKSSLTPLTQAKNIRNYINSNSENTHPHIYYNSKYKEVVCSCVNNQSVAYNELLLRFTSVYTSLTPVSSVPVNDQVYLAYGRRIDATKATSDNTSYTFGNSITPRLKYIVNHNNTLTKTFDIQIIGGKLYNTNDYYSHGDQQDVHRLYNLNITYTTPLKQEGRLTDGQGITDREYDFRFDIPRAGKEIDGKWETGLYGDRLRGKTMQCELWSTTNSTDFSLQYITTKYRMSWS